MLKIIVLTSSLLLPVAQPYQQLPRSFDHYDDKVKRQGYETEQDRQRREFQERWPKQHHCRLPTCSTR